MKLNKKYIFVFFIIIIFSMLSISCGGKNSMASPRTYKSQDKKDNNSAIEKNEVAVDENKNDDANNKLLDVVIKSKPQETVKKDSTKKETEKKQLAEKQKEKSNVLQSHKNETIEEIFYSSVDIDDSATAVDDDLWRQFDLAEEYHAMGVIANREASWEEAQYYFDKSIKILGTIDVESDSLMTPEAVKYSEILDNIISDYRVTLRSLGDLTEDVSASVLIERFGNLAGRIGGDSVVVYKNDPGKITYDIPITMNDRVKSSIAYFQTVAHDAFAKYLRRSKKYTPMMKRILREYDMPEDLIYLSLVESGYNPNAYSWARAMGLWQFISSTGRMYGLKRSWWIDERKDPIKSTHAACQFLKYLYKEFGSWELAMAAYNGGPGRVRRTIKKQKTIDFWKMKLKRQTMDYVPLIMASAVIAKNPEKYGFENIEHEPEIVWDEIEINKCLELSVVAKEVGCSTKELQILNPELLRKYTPPNDKKYILKIPVGTKPKFIAAYDAMPSPKETSWVKHKIKRGQTVSTIAAKYGVSQYAILEANDLKRRSKIYAGKTIIVPVPLDREYAKNKNKDYSSHNSIYVVQSGDNLWDISRAFGTSVSSLRRNNYIERGSRIYVGQKLKIPSNASKLKNKNKTTSKSKKTYASESSSAKGEIKKHKVTSGDTLWDIARKYGTTTSNIRKINGLGRSSRIYPGQILKVVRNAKYTVHKVRRGETLSSIASKYRTSIARIRANNNINDPDLLTVGTKLMIY